jgi:hypothetical protein
MAGEGWERTDGSSPNEQLYEPADPRHSSFMLSLIVTGFDAEPEVVTEILQIEPTSVRRKGDVGKKGKPSRSSGWHFDVHPGRLTDGQQHEDALAKLMARLRDREVHFTRLHSEVRPSDVGIYGGMYVPANGQCGIWLMPDDMMTLARCGLAWDMHLSAGD